MRIGRGNLKFWGDEIELSYVVGVYFNLLCFIEVVRLMDIRKEYFGSIIIIISFVLYFGKFFFGSFLVK